jgi:hypothetical protein
LAQVATAACVDLFLIQGFHEAFALGVVVGIADGSYWAAYDGTDGGARKHPLETGSAFSVDVLYFGPPSASRRDLTQNVNLLPKRGSNNSTENRLASFDP